MELVHGNGGQQGFDAGDKCDRQHTQKNSRPVTVGGADQCGEADCVKEVARQADSLRGRVRQHREGGRGDDGYQGAGHHADLRWQLGPQQQDRDHHHADDDVGQVVIDDALGQRLEVLPGGTLRGAAHQDMDLLQRDGHTDAGQHGVDHHGRDGQCGTCDAAESEQDLQQARTNGDQACHLPAELVDDFGDHHSEAGGRAADLKW
ncbi:Uncharacterised protein [Mycobacteroides abscessus subsp. massiliense]|nr:Uncharacterised protein [Mycobacteroides abscessus subsp. massiliense]